MYLQVFERLRGLYLYLQVFAKFAAASKLEYWPKHFGRRAKKGFNKYFQIKLNLKTSKNKFSHT
jgi:hypothetical protein